MNKMFKINYRIVDDFEVLRSLTKEEFDQEYDQIIGDFQICFGDHLEGSYYHENPLVNGEEGDELLDYWFEQILQVIIVLDQGSEYVAIKEIETVNRLIEFVRKEEKVLINVAIDDTNNSSLLITEKHSFSYIEPLDFVIPYNELKLQVLEVTRNFLSDLEKINSCLCSTEVGKMINHKYTTIMKSGKEESGLL